MTESKRSLVLRPIGTVKGNEIRLNRKWIPSLQEIEGFSHLIVLCWLDRAKKPEAQIRIEGRNIPSKIGHLATRTHRRPNPIAVTVVELLERKGSALKVRGLDVWDGTPVIDVKPYTPRDSFPKCKIPSWVKALDDRETDPLRRYSNPS